MVRFQWCDWACWFKIDKKVFLKKEEEEEDDQQIPESFKTV